MIRLIIMAFMYIILPIVSASITSIFVIPRFDTIFVQKKLKKNLKKYSIIMDIQLVKKSYKHKYLTFDITLNSGELVMDVLSDKDPRKDILESINYFSDFVFDYNWIIKTNFIED